MRKSSLHHLINKLPVVRIILFRIRFFLRQDILPSVRWYTLTPLFNTQYVILRKFHFQINGSINPALFYYLYYPFSAVKTHGVSFNLVNFSRLSLNVSNYSFWLSLKLEIFLDARRQNHYFLSLSRIWYSIKSLKNTKYLKL